MVDIEQINNELGESEFDIEEFAKEWSLHVDPNNPMSISVGQYCFDQLMIMHVNFSLHSIVFTNILPIYNRTLTS